jgi:hypothetical protein
MNHRPQNLAPHAKRLGLTISQAIEGFILHKTAQGLSQRTIESYKEALDHWAAYSGTEKQVEKFF